MEIGDADNLHERQATARGRQPDAKTPTFNLSRREILGPVEVPASLEGSRLPRASATTNSDNFIYSS